MSMNDTFSFKRFMTLYKHQLVLNSKLILFGTLGYCGSIFIILFMMHLDVSGKAFTIKAFVPLIFIFIIAFGVLYNGYSFKSLRSKEGSIGYLLLPASVFEKFLLEFINRIMISIICLPILFWITFNTIGAFFDIVNEFDFEVVSISDLYDYSFDNDSNYLYLRIFIPLILLIYTVPFTGSVVFMKQPLIKTLFSVTILIFSYAGLTYFLAEIIGLNQYRLEENGYFIPIEKDASTLFFEIVLWLSNVVFLTVAFLKLKEKEV